MYGPGVPVPTLPPNSFGAPSYGAIPSTGMFTPAPGGTPPMTLPMTGKGMGKGYGAMPMSAPMAYAPPSAPLAYGYDAPTMPEAERAMPQGGQKEDEDLKKWDSVRRLVAYMFTLTLFTVLSAPTIVSIQLGMDVDAGFWIGKWGLLALFVPVFLLGQHFYHLWMLGHKARRRRYIFVIVPVLPAVLFMVIGGTYMSFARHLYGQLKSEDCSPNGPTPAKFWMQTAYNEAHTAYDQCIRRLESQNFGKPLRRHPSLQSCSEWEELMSDKQGVKPWKAYKISPGTLRQHNPSNEHRWQYLANTEANHLCGGFCTPGPSLFVSYSISGRQGGSCSQFVAFRFLSVQHMGTVLFAMGLIILILAIPTYIFSRSALTNMGYKSAVTIA